MYYVYVLFSEKDRSFYIGYSSNLRLRYEQHCKGLVKSTKNRAPMRLIYYEAYISKLNAEQRELFYKSGRGREVLRKILKETIDEI
jgi:putative endonuclease